LVEIEKISIRLIELHEKSWILSFWSCLWKESFVSEVCYVIWSLRPNTLSSGYRDSWRRQIQQLRLPKSWSGSRLELTILHHMVLSGSLGRFACLSLCHDFKSTESGSVHRSILKSIHPCHKVSAVFPEFP
jgi:hypothetical protein